MSRGIVKVKPRVTQKGSLTVTEAGPNAYNVTDGAVLNFNNPEPEFTVFEGNTVECEILSEYFCKVLRVL